MLAYAAGQTEALADAVSSLAAEPIDHHSDHAIGDGLVEIRRQIDRLEAEFIRRLRRFDRGRAALAEGAVSTVSWLRGTCGLSGAAAAERVRMARVLDALPQTIESFRAGRTSFGNVALIARLADDVGAEATRTVEDTLVAAAAKLDVGRMGSWSRSPGTASTPTARSREISAPTTTAGCPVTRPSGASSSSAASSMPRAAPLSRRRWMR